MPLKLPPLKTLNTFVACSKNLNFSKTALQLNLTQGAVSKQIALLEDFLGLQLFKRKNNQSLELTKEAKVYAKKIGNILGNIEAATTEIIVTKKSEQKETLHINCLPSMSSTWLVPLLKDFEDKFPHYNVVVKIGDGPVDFKKAGCDLAIRVAKQKNNIDWKKFKSTKIMDEKLLCVCSAQFKKKNKIKQPSDLLQHNLLGHTYRPRMWQKYLDFLGLRKPNINHSNSFEHFFMLIEAAKNGMGVGLVPEFLVKKELKNNQLTLAVRDEFKSRYGYFLLQQKQKNTPQKISDFTNWISEVAKNTTI